MADKRFMIDDVSYDVKIVDLKRTSEVLDKYAYRTEDGVLHRKPIGTYFNYEVVVNVENDLDLYERLFNKLTEPVASHLVKFPNEASGQDRYISSVSDGILRVNDDGTYYKDLAFSAICIAPSRKG